MTSRAFVYFVFVLILLSVTACSSDGIKEKINHTGDAAGQVIGEFTSGVSSGVEKAISPKIELGERAKQLGIAFGKTDISADSAAGENVLIAYLIFNKKFQGNLTAKVFDNSNLEMGRTRIDVTGETDEAKFVEFHFDKRTDIDNGSRILIE